MGVKIAFIIAFIAAFFLLAIAKTYPIAEPDALSEMEEKFRAAIKDMDNETKRAAARFKSNSGVTLSKAVDNDTYYIDPTYTLDKDVAETDIKGVVKRIFYPAGYTFNPLDYFIILPPEYIIFNYCDEAERNFVQNYLRTSGTAKTLISAGCPIKDIKAIDNHSVYLLDSRIALAFNLNYTLSIVTVTPKKPGRRFKINVFSVN
jgi:conjugal transfer pilus assembly protein TraW